MAIFAPITSRAKKIIEPQAALDTHNASFFLASFTFIFLTIKSHDIIIKIESSFNQDLFLRRVYENISN